MDNGLVSIIIPMYNSEETIIKSISSVLNQDYRDIEIIIVDDGSNDNSYNIVNLYIHEKKIQDKIKLIKQENRGPSAARNKGISISKGKYIAFLDSDDIWLKNKLIEQIKIMNKYNDISLLTCMINDNKLNHNTNLKYITFNKLLFKNCLTTSTVILKRNVIEDIGVFDDKKKYSEDYDLWLRISIKYRCAIINKSLAICGEKKPVFGFSGLSSNLKEMQNGEISNYYSLYKLKYINLCKFITVYIFSYIKYVRRIVLSKKYKV